MVKTGALGGGGGGGGGGGRGDGSETHHGACTIMASISPLSQTELWWLLQQSLHLYATQCACILYILHCNGHFRVFTYYYKFVCTGFNISLDLSHLHVCVYHGIQAS